MAGVRAIEGVDNTLLAIATDAVAGLSPRPTVSVGPLDREEDGLRLNWFLYSIRSNPAFANMEPPRTGTRTARGVPPLALELGYVLTAHPGPLTATGQQPQFADRGLIAVMQALHGRAIIGEGDAVLAPEAGPLVEPLRITLDALDLDAVSKIWTAASQPMRTTVGYRVSLAVVDATRSHVAGPPVRERRLGIVPSMGPRFGLVTPARVAAGLEFHVVVSGAAAVTFSLRREAGDPAGDGDWPLPATTTGPDRYRVVITPADLAPGARSLSVVAVGDQAAGGDRTGVTLVPTITATDGPVPPGGAVTLTTAHVGSDAEVFLDGIPLDASDVAVVSPTEVVVTVPATAAPGTHELLLRSAHTAGPVFAGLEVT